MKFFSISGFFCGSFGAIPNTGAVLPLRRMNDLICHPKQMRKKKTGWISSSRSVYRYRSIT